MDSRVQLITLGVPDLDAARRFYVEGLGWPVILDVPGEVTFVQVGHGLALSLFGAQALEDDIGTGTSPARDPAPVTLAQIVATEEDVARALDDAVRAGGTVLKPPQPAEWGGFHGYFADPAGFRWEVAVNPGWAVAPDGAVSIGDSPG